MHVRHIALVALPSLALAACGPKSGETEGPVPTAGVMTEEPTDDGLVKQLVDMDGDGQADVHNYFRERADGPRLLVRKDSDLNRDSKIDVRTHFDTTGRIEKEEMDGDFDGNIDWVDHYQGGKRTLSEVDTNYDRAFDLFKVYEGGTVRRKERDTDFDGKVDFWEYLDDKGNVTKVGRDIDGDGVMDVRED